MKTDRDMERGEEREEGKKRQKEVSEVSPSQKKETRTFFYKTRIALKIQGLFVLTKDCFNKQMNV